MVPAIFTSRRSSGNGMVLSRSLSTKNLRFGLLGGASVSMAIHCGTIRKNLPPGERSIFSVAISCTFNDLTGLRWLRESFKSRERQRFLGLKSWALRECDQQSPENVRVSVRTLGNLAPIELHRQTSGNEYKFHSWNSGGKVFVALSIC